MSDFNKPLRERQNNKNSNNSTNNSTATYISNKLSDINAIINDRIDKSVYNKLVSIPPNDLFKYICVIIFCLLLVRLMNINITIIFGLILGLVIVYLLYDKNELEINTFDDQIKFKLLSIVPKPKNFDNYTKLIQLIYSIRDFYEYNPDIFTNLINSLDSYIRIYEDIKIGIEYCHLNVDVAKQMAKNALNSLHSFIYTIDNNDILEVKLRNAMVELQKLLTYYTNDMITICNSVIDKNGYNTKNKRIHDKGPKEYNLYHNNEYNYEIY